LRIFTRLINYYVSDKRDLIRRLRPILGFTPEKLDNYQLAFYHRSNHLQEDKKPRYNNERLEYLGDALLSMVVAEYLFKKYPNSDEGFLTKMRAKIVKRKTLNQIGDLMGLDMILMEYNQTALSKSMLGNALEALVGAVYLECGYAQTKKFVINQILRTYLDVHKLENQDDNFKSKLLEWCQKKGKEISFELVDQYKVDKRDRFKIAVIIEGKPIAEADDFNKKSAEQNASEIALQQIALTAE